MPKAGFYAVKKGRQPGVYSTWDECQSQTVGFSGAIYKKFNSLRDAEVFIGVKPIETAATKAAATAYAAASSTLGAASGSTAPRKSLPTSAPKAQKASSSKTPQYKVEDESKFTVAYTDGACRGNGKAGSIAGIGVWYGVGDARNLAERCPGAQTNNRAELIAIVRCLETDLEPDQPLLIKTDSQYSIGCMNKWLPGWIAKGWKNSEGKEVKNKEIIQHLAKLLDNRPSKTIIQHIKGHAGHEGNEGADQLAGQGATMPELPDRQWDTEEIDGVVTRRLSEPQEDDSSINGVGLKNVQVEDYMPYTQAEMDEMERTQNFG